MLIQCICVYFILYFKSLITLYTESMELTFIEGFCKQPWHLRALFVDGYCKQMENSKPTK